jgi:hypothetical protein
VKRNENYTPFSLFNERRCKEKYLINCYSKTQKNHFSGGENKNEEAFSID